MIRVTEAAVQSAAAAIDAQAWRRNKHESIEDYYRRIAGAALSAAVLDLVEELPGGGRPIPATITRLGRPAVMERIANSR